MQPSAFRYTKPTDLHHGTAGQLAGGVQPNQGVEIGRLALLDDVPGNGETFTLGRAFRLLRRTLPDLRAVPSYADTMERRDAGGKVFKPGHRGKIYVAFSGIYLGRSSARTLTLGHDGRCINGRTLSKPRNGERGAGYAERQLLAMGAPARRAVRGRRRLRHACPLVRSIPMRSPSWQLRIRLVARACERESAPAVRPHPLSTRDVH